MIIDKILDYLEDNGIGNILIGELPFDKSDCAAMVATVSPDPNKAIPYYVQNVDVWARYSKYDEGYKKLQDIFDILHRNENYEIDGYHIYLSYAVGMITDFDRDAERRHLFKLSLAFVYRIGEEFS
jgi:hypothetical protein